MKLSFSIFLLVSSTISNVAGSPNMEVLRTRDLLPRAPLSEIIHYARTLDEGHPLVRDLSTHIEAVTHSIISKRMALPLAYAEAMAKGGGGGKGGGAKGPKGPDGKGGGGQQPPPGLNAEGKKAWEDCTRFQNSQGDCSAMKGPFAQMGCSLGSLKGLKPCENGNLQEALRKDYCEREGKKKGYPYNRFC